jgi:hypothetical protein
MLQSGADGKRPSSRLARRLAVIMYRMRSDGTEFHWTKEKAFRALLNRTAENSDFKGDTKRPRLVEKMSFAGERRYKPARSRW